MRQKQVILDDLSISTVAKSITATYEEIAGARLLRIRASVAQTRAFLNEVDSVYKQIRLAYQGFDPAAQKRHFAFLSSDRKKPSLTQVKYAKKVYILLSANRGLYGDLPQRLVSQYIKTFEQDSTTNLGIEKDFVVVGRVGQYFMDNMTTRLGKIKYKAFSLDDDRPSAQDINTIMDYILPYEAINVTYGKYNTLLSLSAESSDLSGTIGNTNQDEDSRAQQLKLSAALVKQTIFEPSLEVVVTFFDTEVLKALFRQRIFETQLARFASRMIAMDTATVNAEKRISNLENEVRQLKKHLSSKKLEQLFSGMSLWEGDKY